MTALYEARKTVLLGARPAQRICGWCRLELAAGTQPATYGICPACIVRFEADALTGAA
jgi:hypothetical protein